MKIGVAFGESIRTEKLSKKRHYNSLFGGQEMREKFIFFCLFVGMLILLTRTFFVQVVEGQYYRSLSDENRIKTTLIHAPRGILFDRNGQPLVFNAPGFRRSVNGKTVLIEHEKALESLAKGEKNLEIDTLRSYPYAEAFAHVLGYTGQISEDELKEEQFHGYTGGDIIGKAGIEKEYEKTLAGVDGKELFEIDAQGKEVRRLGVTDAVPGKDIVLTLDKNLQMAAFDALRDVKKGAAVVSTPQGEILALVSAPFFNPNLFTLPVGMSIPTRASSSSYMSVEDVVLDSENQPLLNRVVGGAYPPGSTFKLITAAAGLEKKVVDENYEVVDNGVITLGAFSFANWYFLEHGRTEGPIKVVKAISRSNDIYFYKLAELIGQDDLALFAKKFGAGRRLGIDVEGEVGGTVPDSSWKKRVIGEQWYLGDTYHYGIGQGYMLSTPLQVNMWTSVFASGGKLYEPRLVKNAVSKVKNENFLSKKTIDLVRQGMIDSCATGGVAWPFFEFRIKNKELRIDGKNFLEVPESTISGKLNDFVKVVVACKTGTAQHGGLTTLPHAWITLFAPAYNPEIVVTVLVDSGGQGSSIAGPIAKKIVEAWFTSTANH